MHLFSLKGIVVCYWQGNGLVSAKVLPDDRSSACGQLPQGFIWLTPALGLFPITVARFCMENLSEIKENAGFEVDIN